MTVLVAYSHTPEGQSALRHGHRVALSEQSPLVAFDLDTSSEQEDRGIAAPTTDTLGADADVRWIGRRRQDPDAANELLDTAEELGASLIVLGIRRRSAVGKLLMGSNAQRILLGADIPVLAVKADRYGN